MFLLALTGSVFAGCPEVSVEPIQMALRVFRPQDQGARGSRIEAIEHVAPQDCMVTAGEFGVFLKSDATFW